METSASQPDHLEAPEEREAWGAAASECEKTKMEGGELELVVVLGGEGGGGLQKSRRTLCCDKECSDFFESALTAGLAANYSV